MRNGKNQVEIVMSWLESQTARKQQKHEATHKRLKLLCRDLSDKAGFLGCCVFFIKDFLDNIFPLGCSYIVNNNIVPHRFPGSFSNKHFVIDCFTVSDAIIKFAEILVFKSMRLLQRPRWQRKINSIFSLSQYYVRNLRVLIGLLSWYVLQSQFKCMEIEKSVNIIG